MALRRSGPATSGLRAAAGALVLLVGVPAARAQVDSVAAGHSPSVQAVYKDPDDRFTLRYPRSWEVDGQPGDPGCFRATPKSGDDPFRSSSGPTDILGLVCLPHEPGGPSAAELDRVLDDPDFRAPFLESAMGISGEPDGPRVDYGGHGLARLGDLSAVRLLTRVTVPSPDGVPVVVHVTLFVADAPTRDGRFVLTCGSVSPGADLCDAVASTFEVGSGGRGLTASRAPAPPPVEGPPEHTWARWTLVREDDPRTGEEEVSVRTGTDQLGLAFVCAGGGPVPVLLHVPLRGDADGKVDLAYRIDGGSDEGPYRSRLMGDGRRSLPFGPGEGGPFLVAIGRARTLTLTVADPGGTWRSTETLDVRGLSRALTRMPCQ